MLQQQFNLPFDRRPDRDPDDPPEGATPFDDHVFRLDPRSDVAHGQRNPERGDAPPRCKNERSTEERLALAHEHVQRKPGRTARADAHAPVRVRSPVERLVQRESAEERLLVDDRESRQIPDAPNTIRRYPCFVQDLPVSGGAPVRGPDDVPQDAIDVAGGLLQLEPQNALHRFGPSLQAKRSTRRA